MTKMLTSVEPREQAGRKMITGVSFQFIAAGYAALEILDGGPVTFVYCDFHDDYVVKLESSGGELYRFSQVKFKFKRNYQWTPLDLFGVPLRGEKINLDAVKNSFGVKMFEHIVNFGDQCESLILETNVNFHDKIEELCQSVGDNDLSHLDLPIYKKIKGAFLEHFSSKKFDSHVVCYHLEKFFSVFKLMPATSYLNEESGGFEMHAGQRIYQYSEIDLSQKEKESIASSLTELVRSKSVGLIGSNITEEKLNKLAGIGLDDLLSVLSISRRAYMALSSSGDKKAIKNTSILQRILKDWGCDEDIIVFCCEKKNEWDEWQRINRHDIPLLDLTFLIDRLHRLMKVIEKTNEPFSQLQIEIDSLYSSLSVEIRERGISKEIILGGFMNSIVRGEL
jgi:hypothetical protein